MTRAIVLLACAVGCRSGNFLTVELDNVPCSTEALTVTVSLGDATDDTSFTNISLDDGVSSLAIDLGDHTSGTLVVSVVATNQGHMLAGASQPVTLPKHAIVLDLHGASCSMVDAPTVDLSCWHGIIPPTNFGPCDNTFPKPDGSPLEIDASTSLDTGGDASKLYTFGTDTYYLLHVPSVTIGPAGNVTVIGKYPLLIVSDTDVTIDGSIVFFDSQPASECESIDPPQPSVIAAGGGGGGYGTKGADGGQNRNSAIPGGVGGAANGNTSLFPLRTGCAGGAGGGAIDLSGGAGGTAPGAIQITAVESIAVMGSMLANGRGGGAGQHNGGKFSGGGGGASGGAILLEAKTVTVAGKVCAVGGGGGEGGTLGNIGSGITSGDCTGGMGGGAGSTAGTGGGRGGDDIDPSPGGDAVTSGGGGGGGAAGRIRVHGDLSVSGSVVPTPSL